MTFMSVETVPPPKDGSAILAYEGEDGAVAVARFWDGQWWVNGASGYYIVPEYWRPIPEGPSGERWGPIDKRPALVVVPNGPPEAREGED